MHDGKQRTTKQQTGVTKLKPLSVITLHFQTDHCHVSLNYEFIYTHLKLRRLSLFAIYTVLVLSNSCQQLQVGFNDLDI